MSSSESNSTARSTPGHIRKLDATVINRIAAGEIINRPSNALKELIENSLDAGATSISISIKDGGLKLLQIQDNGHGIRADDLAVVCERFTTSKLRTYDDLSSIETYGFRGEALASISHVSHLSITTKQASSECAYKAHYVDGKLAPERPNENADPKPCAGNNGTLIVAEDMFYNILSRRSALKNTREEYNRIFEVASRYAIHNSGIAFSCRKHGTPKADLNTLPGATTLSNIRQIFGSKVASSLVSIENDNRHFGYEFKGLVSNTGHDMHKTVFLLFINHRLVDHAPIKRSIEALYTSVFPKAARPFVYLDLKIKPQNVDVNIHPTKREVRFLNEDEIINTIIDTIQKKLLKENESQKYNVQTTLGRGASGELQNTSALQSGSALICADTDIGIITRGDTGGKTSVQTLLPVSESPKQNMQAQGQGTQKTPVNRTVRTNFKTIPLESFSFGSSPSIKRTSAKGPTASAIANISPSKPSPGAALLNMPGLSSTLQVDSDLDFSLDSASRLTKGIANANKNIDIQLGSSTLVANRDEIQPRALEGQLKSLVSNGSKRSTDSHFTRDQNRPITIVSATQTSGQTQTIQASEHTETSLGSSHTAAEKKPRIEVRLTSILNLRKELQKHTHIELTQILSTHTFVGFIDDTRALIQYQTKLYMIDYCKISYHLFFHCGLFDFMNYGFLVLQPAPSIYDLAHIAAVELGNENPDKAASEILERFTGNSEMLEEYFNIKISDTGTLESLPMFVKDYSPDFDKLPLFLYNATYFVNWNEEQPFFKSFINAIAVLYSLEPPLMNDPQNVKDEYRLMVEHRILPALKGSSFWAPDKLLMEDAITDLVDLPDLYRIFERC